MENIRVKELNGLALAYLGDAVWELRLREKFIARNLKVKELNKLVKAHVSAVAQSKIYLSIIDELEDEYRACARRARNSKISTFPKSSLDLLKTCSTLLPSVPLYSLNYIRKTT